MKNIRLLFLFFTINTLYINAQEPILLKKNLITKFELAQKLSASNKDSTLVLLKSVVNSLAEQKDSLAMLSCIKISKIQGLNQNFADAFDYAIQGLRIAEHLKDSVKIANLSGELGGLYKEFGKEAISKKYLNSSLNLYKKLYNSKKVKLGRLAEAHFNLALHYRTFFKYNNALKHIDTCEIISKNLNKPSIYNSYHKAEQAAIFIANENTTEAISILNNISNDIEKRLEDNTLNDDLKGFLTIIYGYLGDAYQKNNNYSKAIFYYKKSLQNNERFGLHNSNRTQTYESLAISNFQLKNFKQGFIDLKKSKELADTYWSANSKKNSNFIEISDKHQKKLENQRFQLLKQDKLLAQQKQRLLIFQIVLISFLFLLILGFLLFRNKTQRLNFKLEKESLHQRSLEANKALEIKNKELTIHTLQLIEKEKIISSLSENLKEISNDDPAILSKLKSLNANSKILWEEFNNRFVEVNNGFYERIKERFPELSPTERKHCALIKLKFKGKEMAHLLGITEHSVHVSRYRLRKKMNLKTSQNLAEYIGEI